MENISDFVIVCSWVWSMVFLFVGIFLVIAWGEYWLRKREPGRRAKNQRRLDDKKALFAMERRVGFRRS